MKRLITSTVATVAALAMYGAATRDAPSGQPAASPTSVSATAGFELQLQARPLETATPIASCTVTDDASIRVRGLLRDQLASFPWTDSTETGLAELRQRSQLVIQTIAELQEQGCLDADGAAALEREAVQALWRRSFQQINPVPPASAGS